MHILRNIGEIWPKNHDTSQNCTRFVIASIVTTLELVILHAQNRLALHPVGTPGLEKTALQNVNAHAGRIHADFFLYEIAVRRSQKWPKTDFSEYQHNITPNGIEDVHVKKHRDVREMLFPEARIRA